MGERRNEGGKRWFRRRERGEREKRKRRRWKMEDEELKCRGTYVGLHQGNNALSEVAGSL